MMYEIELDRTVYCNEERAIEPPATLRNSSGTRREGQIGKPFQGGLTGTIWCVGIRT